MTSFKMLQAPAVNLALCPVFTGLVEIRGLAETLESASVSWSVECPAVDGKWKFSVTTVGPSKSGSSRWLSFYLINLREPSGYGARFTLTLKAMAKVIAREEGVRDEVHPAGTTAFSTPLLLCAINVVLGNRDLKSEDVATLEYIIEELPQRPLPPQHFPSPAVSLFDIWANMFDDETTSDVCFVVIHPHETRRCPERIYAHSKILAGRCEYFRTLFKSEFSEASVSDPSEDVPNHDEEWEEGSDSDYDTNEKDYSENDGPAERDTGKATSVPLEVKQQKRIVRVRDASYRTYRALLFFLYTSSVSFAPLKSSYLAEKNATCDSDTGTSFQSREEYNEGRTKTISTLSDPEVLQWTSPKSIYKLCDRLDITDLKEVARKCIIKFLTPENVMDELFSAYSGRYHDIRVMEHKYLKNHWVQVCRTSTFRRHVTHIFRDHPNGIAEIMLQLAQELTVA